MNHLILFHMSDYVSNDLAIAEMGDEVIDSFLKGFKEPEKWEGYNEMFTIRNSDDLKAFYASIKQRYPKPEKLGASSGKPGSKKKK